MSPSVFPFLIGGTERQGVTAMDIRAPWDNALVARAAVSTPSDVAEAIGAAEAACPSVAALDRATRAAILERMAQAIAADGIALAETLVGETGKTIRDCRAEVARTVSTLGFCAQAARELAGEVLPLDALPGVGERLALTLAEPIGVVAGLTAVNYPLLIGAHKLGPAIGAGCPVVLKPPDRAPLTTLALARAAIAAGWPAAAASVVPGGVEVGVALTTDPRVRLISFTGSTPAGHAIARQSGTVELLLELGSNAATIVAADADLDLLVERCAIGGFTANGQSCISVQRLLVARERYDDVLAALAPRVRALRVGDPREETTDVGPVVDGASAQRIAELIDDARAHGAELLAGGGRDGRLVEPTLLAGLDDRMRVSREEVFGPVVAVGAFDDLDEAVALANASPYGLQAGVFTNSLPTALALIRRLRVGGVHVNEVSTFRPDQMPYGGVKDSGMGKEGPRYAMHRMTHFKAVSMHVPR
jgi:acyl-CoA reductase-like NAD-dependent aldehyde dehydrogenase